MISKWTKITLSHLDHISEDVKYITILWRPLDGIYMFRTCTKTVPIKLNVLLCHVNRNFLIRKSLMGDLWNHGDLDTEFKRSYGVVLV